MLQIQAIVAAFGFDERTVAAWPSHAGRHGQQVHQPVVQQGGVDRQHVQADELGVKLVGRRVWMAMAVGLTDRPWTMPELLRYQMPLPAWVRPKRRGHPSMRAHQAATPVAAWRRLNVGLPSCVSVIKNIRRGEGRLTRSGGGNSGNICRHMANYRESRGASRRNAGAASSLVGGRRQTQGVGEKHIEEGHRGQDRQ